MPRQGNGSYVLPAGNPVVPSTTIQSTWANTTLNDIGAALTQSISKDGQTTPTANLPMGGLRHTAVGAAVSVDNYARAGQVQNNELARLTNLGTSTGTAYYCTLPLGTVTSFFSDGALLIFLCPITNTGAATLTINNDAGSSILDSSGANVSAGYLVAGNLYYLSRLAGSWRAQPTSGAFVFRAGDTMTGNLNAPNLTAIASVYAAQLRVQQPANANTVAEIIPSANLGVQALLSVGGALRFPGGSFANLDLRSVNGGTSAAIVLQHDALVSFGTRQLVFGNILYNEFGEMSASGGFVSGSLPDSIQWSMPTTLGGGLVTAMKLARGGSLYLAGAGFFGGETTPFPVTTVTAAKGYTATGSLPVFEMHNPGAGVDNKYWRLAGQVNGQLTVEWVNDAYSNSFPVATFARDRSVTVVGRASAKTFLPTHGGGTITGTATLDCLNTAQSYGLAVSANVAITLANMAVGQVVRVFLFSLAGKTVTWDSPGQSVLWPLSAGNAPPDAAEFSTSTYGYCVFTFFNATAGTVMASYQLY